MVTPLQKTLRRELLIKGSAFILTISPESLKVTLKGRRKGLELQWEDLISGDAALATALNASIGKFASAPAPSAPSAAARKPRAKKR
jgi:hypothetical protein